MYTYVYISRMISSFEGLRQKENAVLVSFIHATFLIYFVGLPLNLPTHQYYGIFFLFYQIIFIAYTGLKT
jgi:hypothetical protein